MCKDPEADGGSLACLWAWNSVNVWERVAREARGGWCRGRRLREEAGFLLVAVEAVAQFQVWEWHGRVSV